MGLFNTKMPALKMPSKGVTIEETVIERGVCEYCLTGGKLTPADVTGGGTTVFRMICDKCFNETLPANGFTVIKK